MPHKKQHAHGKKQQKKQAQLHPLNVIPQYKFKGSLEVSIWVESQTFRKCFCNSIVNGLMVTNIIYYNC